MNKQLFLTPKPPPPSLDRFVLKLSFSVSPSFCEMPRSLHTDLRKPDRNLAIPVEGKKEETPSKKGASFDEHDDDNDSTQKRIHDSPSPYDEERWRPDQASPAELRQPGQSMRANPLRDPDQTSLMDPLQQQKTSRNPLQMRTKAESQEIDALLNLRLPSNSPPLQNDFFCLSAFSTEAMSKKFGIQNSKDLGARLEVIIHTSPDTLREYLCNYFTTTSGPSLAGDVQPTKNSGEYVGTFTICVGEVGCDG